jgi:chaperonin GroEL (HSP60 family)
LAAQTAKNTLENSALNHDSDQGMQELPPIFAQTHIVVVKFKEDLLNIARTTLSSKILHQEKEHFANLCVDAVLRLKVIFTYDFISPSQHIDLGKYKFGEHQYHQKSWRSFERLLFGRRFSD